MACREPGNKSSNKTVTLPALRWWYVPVYPSDAERVAWNKDPRHSLYSVTAMFWSGRSLWRWRLCTGIEQNLLNTATEFRVLCIIVNSTTIASISTMPAIFTAPRSGIHQAQNISSLQILHNSNHWYAVTSVASASDTFPHAHGFRHSFYSSCRSRENTNANHSFEDRGCSASAW